MKIIYLVTPQYVPFANTEQTHYTLVTYLKSENNWKRVLFVDNYYNWLLTKAIIKSLSYTALELKALGFNRCSINSLLNLN